MQALTFYDLSLNAALANYARLRQGRGRDLQDTLRLVMKYWVSFAMSKIPKGDKNKVQQGLMTLTQKYSRVSARARSSVRSGARGNKYRGTIAAAVVAMLNYRGARLKAAFGNDDAFYGDVASYVNARKYSVNLHAIGGFSPALAVIGRYRTRADSSIGTGSGPKYGTPPGLIEEQLTGDLAEILVENYASAATKPGSPAPLGVGGLPGGNTAFSESLPQIIKLFTQFASQDEMKLLKAAGFPVVIPLRI